MQIFDLQLQLLFR